MADRRTAVWASLQGSGVTRRAGSGAVWAWDRARCEASGASAPRAVFPIWSACSAMPAEVVEKPLREACLGACGEQDRSVAGPVAGRTDVDAVGELVGTELLHTRQLELLREEVAHLHRHTVVLPSMPGRLKRVDELVGLLLAQPVVRQLRMRLDRAVRLEPHFAPVLNDLDAAYQQRRELRLPPGAPGARPGEDHGRVARPELGVLLGC